MSTTIPTISVTNEPHSDSESSIEDSYSNDMDYNSNQGDATDVEDLISQTEAPRSRQSSVNPFEASTKPSEEEERDLTDIEDYNASDSEDDEKSKVYPELKMSLQEFLQQGLQAQGVLNDGVAENIEVKAGNFLKAQNLNGNADYLTDCEDYNTDSEIENDCEKSVCVDFNAAIDDPGKVCIADAARAVQTNEDSEEYEDVSVLSDISDLASALWDATGAGVRGMSEDEILEISGDEEICNIACSGSSSDVDEDSIYDGASNASIPAIDVTFIIARGQQRRNSTTVISNRRSILEVSAINEEVLTDVERLDDSAAEEDGFDDEEESDKPIPRAVIQALGDEGNCQTDTEEIPTSDEACEGVACTAEVPSVAAEALPPPHREMIVLRENKFGDTITNVMPMDDEYQFGIYNRFHDEDPTDSEDYSCAEEPERCNSIAEDLLAAGNLIEGDVTVANEMLKPLTNKRLELHANAESVTDVEEIYVAGTNRRKKLKNRSLSKGKSKFLDIAKGKEEGNTDIEDMELSECGLPPGIKRATSGESKQQTEAKTASVATDKCTDIEDITADEVSDVSDAENASKHADADRHSLNEYEANCANVVHVSEINVTNRRSTKRAAPKPRPKSLKLLQADADNQPHTDVEDVLLPSDAEDNSTCHTAAEQCQCVGDGELNDMLNESCTIVHEKSGSSYDVDAEKLHIKGMHETREAHTDVEYLESDESAAPRGGN